MPKISKPHTTPYFERKFERLQKNIRKAAIRKLLLFEQNPFHPSLNAHKLKGPLSQYWSFYINKNYAKKFLELHQGNIWAESEGKGKGSTFFIELPLE